MIDILILTIIVLIIIVPLIYALIRSVHVGDWKHLRLRDDWDPAKSRGRIKKRI